MTMRMTTTSSLLNETRFNESYFANHSTTDLTTLKIINTTTLPISTTSESDITLTIFFLLLILAFCILLVYTFIKFKIHAVPESIAIIIFGAIIGGILQGMKDFDLGNWQKEEVFDPTFFFVVLLPPIIFESGYSLHKGNFFFNIGSILTFAIIGTAISAIVVGGGIYLLGMAQIIYPLTLTESFAFGSLISAVDPVATLAIFHALNVNPTLNMLVFGESVLNDAVSIVMTNSILEFSKAQALGGSTLAAFKAIGHFFVMFFASSSIGIAFALASALIFKHFQLRNSPSLELGMLLILSYLPYSLSEGLQLSGIMAILFCGIVMAHYTHFNLSPVTQMTVQQIFRTVAFIAETCVFAYLGMALFSFNHTFKPAFIIWSIILCLLGRACNIFPLSLVVNRFREVKISRKMQFVMWFSGLRGAIAFALSIHIEFDHEKRSIIITSTLIIVLFTILVLGGSTLPLLKYLGVQSNSKVTLNKTEEMGNAIDTDEIEHTFRSGTSLKGFARIDSKYLSPFFRRHVTHQEVHAAQAELKRVTNQWYRDIRTSDSDEERTDLL